MPSRSSKKRESFIQAYKPLWIIVSACFIVTWLYLKLPVSHHTQPATTNLGRTVIVYMPNGTKMYTYEKYIIQKDGKTYYKSEYYNMNITNARIEYP